MIGLNIKDASFSYFNGLVLRKLNLSVSPGEIVGLLGPNGSGKTTLIKLASGVLRLNGGEVHLNGTDVRQLNRRTIARSLAVVPQQFSVPFAFTVEEVVTLGRVPFVRAFAEESPADRKAINSAIELAGIGKIKERRFDELSGGERQKVVLAMALAQQPKMLLLDEPTVHLDISHQIDILELVRDLNLKDGLTVIAAMHDLNLAAVFFNRLVLIKEGQVFADGTPLEVLTEENIVTVFNTQVKVDITPGGDSPNITITPRRLNRR